MLPFLSDIYSIIPMDVLPSLSAWIRLQDWQKKLSLLVPEQHRLTEKLRNLNLNKISRG